MDESTVFEIPTSPDPEQGSQSAPQHAAAASVGGARPGRTWIVAALVGAVVGAAVSGGIVASTQRDQRPTPATASAPPIAPAVRVTEAGSIAAILERVEPAVVSISTQGFAPDDVTNVQPRQGAGTGVVLTPDGDVLTNAHVIADAAAIKVKLATGDRTYEATLLGSDPAADIALIRLQGVSNLTVARLGRSADVRVGDQVIAIGNALALPGGPTVTSGIVSALDRTIGTGARRLEHLVQTDAAINPGNSGGPLVNSAAEVVGINTAVIQNTGQSEAQNIGFAIASDTIRPMVDDLRSAGGKVRSPAYLGVSTTTVTDANRERLGVTTGTGAYVTSVGAGTPADTAGIKPGDVIVVLGPQKATEKVTSSDDLGAAVRKNKPGDQVEVRWQRGGADRSATVTLGQTPTGR